MKLQKRKWLRAVLLVVAFGAWLTMEIIRWSTVNQWILNRIAQDMRQFLPHVFSYNTWGGFYSFVIYLLCAGFIVPLYFLTVAIPEQTNVLTSKRNKAYRCTAFAVLAVMLVFSIMCMRDVYGYIFPKSSITGKFTYNLYFKVLMVPCLVAAFGTVALAVYQIYMDLRKAKCCWKGKDYACGIFRFVLSVAVAFVMAFMSFQILRIAKHFIPSIKANYTVGNQEWEAIISSVLFASVFEELMFRGVILNKMRRTMPAWLALVICSLFFGLWHRNIGQFLYTVIMGMFFGCVYLYTGKVRYCIVAHMTNNYLSTVLYTAKGGGKLPGIPWVNRLCKNMEQLSLGGHVLLLAVGVAAVIGVLLLIKATGNQKNCVKSAE